jgi:hypothetical protein
MKSRCNNPKATGYEMYGGRGISVCESWNESFFNFLADMGPRPDGTQLDRIDNDKGYYKENCRWVSSKINCNNTSKNVWIEFEGQKKTITQWAEEIGIKVNTLQYRLYRGWPVERALNKRKTNAGK